MTPPGTSRGRHHPPGRPSDVHRLEGSFRDPSGFMFTDNGILYRQINECYRPDYEKLTESGLYDDLVGKRLLVPHEEADISLARSDSAYKVIRPRLVPFISYPYEWCFSQLKDAALLTLEIQALALNRGMTLKDASAYNVQFLDGRPVLIDTLSFAARREGSPWMAYRQFCQHFAAPLTLMSYRDAALSQLMRVHIDGIPLPLASKLLPAGTRLSPSIQIHIHAHARMQTKYEGKPEALEKTGRRMSDRALGAFIEGLRQFVSGLRWNLPRTVWGAYDETGSYEDEGLRHKMELVEAFLGEIKPGTLWDLGANRGLFSRLASGKGIITVSWDIDPVAVELNYRDMKVAGESNLLPLLLDLTNPSPPIGWANTERSSITERGPVDAIMALALIHHLAIANNLPLDSIAAFFASLGPRLILEFVPKDDARVRQLLASREDIFPDYTRSGLEAAFGRFYRIISAEEIQSSSRVLYLMERLPEA